MAAVTLSFSGGERMKRTLEAMARDLGKAELRVGFLEGTKYPTTGRGKGGQPVAQVAFWNEFGTSRIPPRPFFRAMIARDSGNWGALLARYVKASGYHSLNALQLMGISIKDALVASIAQWPADNAPSTVRRKGFNHGLVDTGVMQRAPDFEVRI
jgi:hypothetical protein